MPIASATTPSVVFVAFLRQSAKMFSPCNKLYDGVEIFKSRILERNSAFMIRTLLSRLVIDTKISVS